MSPDLSLRLSTEADLDVIAAAEGDPEASPFITVRPRERHLEAFGHPNEEHLIIEADGKPAGYALLEGFAHPHGNIEIHTLVIARRDQGVGTRAIRLLLERIFDHHGAHRVWLDVLAHNARARHVYESLGFTPEGEMREAWRRDDGGYESLHFLGMLDREWAELRERAADPAA